mgnify:CR=1 FL=1
MTEYIDRSALGIGNAKREAFTIPEYADGWNSAIKIIDNAPTVDAVEVVRCRDCEHFKIGEDNVYYCRRDKLGRGIFMRKSDFCSYGERKDGDGNG